MATGFDHRLEIPALKDKYARIWESTPDTFPDWQIQYGRLQQREKDARMSSYTDDVIRLVKGFPGKCAKGPEQDPELASKKWGTALKKLIYNCGTDIAGFDGESMRLLLEGGFCEATSGFITEARRLDSGFTTDNIFQALRNVWIMNCIQLLMGFKAENTPSVLAYSMLYPYTDNYLDTYLISAQRKNRVNERFGLRLAGEKIKAENEFENKLFSMVQIMEGQFERESYPMVYTSLLGIHFAQVRSLRQQAVNMSGKYADILNISIEKGGASVLADACLVKGSLSQEEASFAFGFGVLLQFLDDLQDAAADRSNGHFTLFSVGNNCGSVEKHTNKLINFIRTVINEDNCFISPEAMRIKSLMVKSIELMLLGAVAGNSGMYGSDYLKKLEIYSPLGFGSLRKFYKRIGKEYSKLKLKFAVKPMEVPMAEAFAAGTV